MSLDPKNPLPGAMNIDGSEFEPYVVDLAPGECQGMMVTRDGFAAVCQELLANQATLGTVAGIPDQEITNLSLANERIARLDIFILAFAKALEMLTETRYQLDDQRQRIALDAAQSVDRRSKRHPELLAGYQLTREYRSEIAKKALKTKKENAEAAATAANKAPAQPDASAPG